MDDIYRTILDQAESSYGIVADKTRLFDGEIDDNLKVKTRDQGSFLVKISPPGTSFAALDWQITILDQLATFVAAGHTPGFSLPRLYRTHAGHALITVADHSVRVMSWVDGELIATQGAPDEALLADIGRVSAVLTRALAPLQMPADLPRHQWVAERGADSLRRNLAQLSDGAAMETLQDVLTFHQQYEPIFPDLPRGTVHQDLSDYNLLVDPRAPDRVAGVIDFNDAVTTLRVADIALAGAYAMLRQPQPLDSFLAVVKGYQRHQSLTPAEREVVFPMAIARLCVNWTTWKVKAQVDGPSDYGAGKMCSTWPVIECMATQGLASVQNQVLARLNPSSHR